MDSPREHAILFFFFHVRNKLTKTVLQFHANFIFNDKTALINP